MKFKRFITFICIVALLLQGGAVALPAFAQGINKPYVTQYGLYNYIDSNTESPSAVTVLTTGNTGENFSPPPWTVLNDVPYLFDSDDVIGIRFAVNVATPTYWDDNRTRLAMQDADGSLVPINVLRSGDGTSQDVNRNYIYVSPQGRLEPASSYKITVDSGLTSNNGQQAGVQQEIDFTTRPDTTLPTWPSGSTLTASSIGSSSLTLSWTPASDDVGVTSYKILKDGSPYTTVSGMTTICSVTGLAAGTAYEFEVQAGDASGNWTTAGPSVGATTSVSSSDGVSLSLSTNSTVARGYVTASGIAGPNRWVTIQALDSASQIVFFDAVKANAIGNYGKTFRVPDAAAGTLTVVAGYGSNVAAAGLSVAAVTDIAAGNINVDAGGSNKNLAVTGSSPANVSVTVPNGVNDARISVSDLLGADGSGGLTSSPLPAMNITAGVTINSAPVQVELTIPAGAAVSGPEGWDGTINVPVVQPAGSVTVTPDSGKTASVNTVIEVGFGDVPLTFSKAVRLLIPGQAGKDAGYYRGGTFTKITNILPSDSQAAGDALPAGGDGKIDAGSDLVIWTKHFTRFVTYTQTATGGGDSGGGGTPGSDKQAPTWPSDYTFTINKVGEQVTLQWSAAEDNVGVSCYEIYRDTTSGQPLATVEANNRTYTGVELKGHGSHTYYIRAVDAAGNKSNFISASSGGSNPVDFQGAYLTTAQPGYTSSDLGASVEGSGSVPVMPTIKLVFGRNVCHDSIWDNNKNCIALQESSGANVAINVFRLSGDTTSDERRHIFLKPLSNLTPGETYKIIVAPNLTANNGRKLGEDTNNQNLVITFTVQGNQVNVSSASGSAAVPRGQSARISLGEEAIINLPAGALKEADVEVKIVKVASPPAAPEDAKAISDVYEFTIGGKTTYNFAEKVTLTFKFNTSDLKTDEEAAVFYYDDTAEEWVNIGGDVSGSYISAEIDHFTKFAVFAVEKAKKPVQPVVQQPVPELSDISGHWAEAGIIELVALGAIGGYPDGSFKPDNKITRAEFTSILVPAFKLELRSGKVFADTDGHWAQEAIATASSFGIVSGYDADTFGPDDPVTREQMAAMVVKAAGLTPAAEALTFTDSGSISGWAKSSMAAAVKNGIINGYPDNTVRPQGNATRAEAVTVIVNALHKLGK